MSKSINNIVRASKNVVHSATSIIAVGEQMIADGSELLNSGITDTPKVMGALLSTPFAAAKGYIMETEGVTAEVAEARAYKYINQELSRTITEVGVGSGKLLADLLKQEEDSKPDVSVVNKEVVHVNQVGVATS